MVDLPKIDDSAPQVRAPSPMVSPGQIAQPREELAQTMDKAASTFNTISVALAKKAAAEDLLDQKVTRNADGSVNVENPATAPLLFGDAATAYKDAVAAGTIAQHANALSTSFSELHTKYAADPQGFKAASDAYLASQAQTLRGPVGEAVQREGAQLQTQHFNAISNRTASIDVETQKKSILAQIDDQKNTAIALARQDGVNSSTFQAAVARMNVSYDALGKNPLFEVSPEQIEIEKRNTQSLLRGEALTAQVDSIFSRPNGKAEAQKLLTEGILNNPALSLSPAERNRLYHQGMSRLEYLTGDAKEAVDANRKTVTEMETTLANGKLTADDPAVGMAVKRSIAIGDYEGAQRINAAAAVQQHLRGIQSLPDGQRAQALGVPGQPDLTQITAPNGRPVTVSKGAATAFDGFLRDLAATGYKIDDVQGYNNRKIFGTNYMSQHASGLAIDVNPDRNPTGDKLVTDLPPNVSQIAAKWGLKWGGDWESKKDAMHFELASAVPQIQGRQDGNLKAADAALNLTPQEKALYQRHLTNLTGPGGVDNPDGSRSTLFQAVQEHNGRFYNIPTVWNGRIETEDWTRPSDGRKFQVPNSTALANVDRAGWESFPSYATPEEADARYDKMHGFMEKDTSDYFAGRRFAAPAANGGPGFTEADVQRNPFLLSAYVRSLAADPETRVQSAKQTAAAIGKGLDNGILPSPDAVAEVRQAAALHPDKMGEVGDELEGRLQGAVAASLPKEQRDVYLASLKDAAQGQDVHHIATAAATLRQVDEQDRNMREHPLQEGHNRGWTQPPAPIDPGQPEAIAPALVQRAGLATRIGTLNASPPPPLLDKDEMPKLQAALQGPKGPDVLASITAGLKPDEMAMLVKESGFRDSVTGMSRSGDPAKMNAAYSFMDSQQKANPLEFDKQFPDGLKDLRAWQSLLAFYPPDVAAKRMLQAYDPAMTAAREASAKVADEALKLVSPAAVVSKFSTGWGPFGTGARAPTSDQAGLAAGALKADYDRNYRDGFAATGDPKMANAFAMEKLGNKYAVSPTNGNRVMPNAPERYYPEVGGSHDWMGRQLDDAVKAFTGADAAAAPAQRTARGGEVAARREALGTIGSHQYDAKRALVADDQTERDIANGKPPSYQVVLQGPDGRWTAMSSPDAKVQRFHFDPTQPFADRATEMEGRRTQAANAMSLSQALP